MTLKYALNSFILDQRLRGNTDKTIRGYQGYISLFVNYLANCGIEDISALGLPHVQKYQLYISARNCENKNQKLTRRTVRTYMKHIRIFLAFCYAENYIAEPFHLKMKIPRAEKPFIEILTDDEVARLLGVCGDDVLGRRNRAIIALMIDCGLRLSEVSGLCRAGINAGYIKVTGKGRKGRIIPIGNHARQTLDEYISVRPVQPCKNIFLSVREKPLTASGITQIFRRLKNHTGISRLHAHLLRHTFATNFLVHGLGDIYELSLILGHSDIKTTEGYLQLASYYKILRNKSGQTYLDKQKARGFNGS